MSKVLPELYLIVGQESLLFPVGSWAGEAEISCGSKYRLVSQLEIDVLGAVCSRLWLCVFHTSVGVSMGVHFSPVLRTFPIPGQPWAVHFLKPCFEFHKTTHPEDLWKAGRQATAVVFYPLHKQAACLWEFELLSCLSVTFYKLASWKKICEGGPFIHSVLWYDHWSISFTIIVAGMMVPACSPTRVVETGSEVQG